VYVQIKKKTFYSSKEKLGGEDPHKYLTLEERESKKRSRKERVEL